MPRPLNKLNSFQVKQLIKASKANFYSDGGGLYLQVSKLGTGSWVFRYEIDQRRRAMGLGSTTTVSLADARIAALEARQLLQQRLDPLQQKQEAESTRKKNLAKMQTFNQCAAAYIKTKKSEWKNEKHHQQWENTLATYVSPIFGNLPVAEIDTNLILKALEPIWTEKNETATRLRGRIEKVLDWAKVRGFRDGENPARLKGHIDTLMPGISRRRRTQHHPALPYIEIQGFITTLREQQEVSALALEFCILTATRTSETMNAMWAEINTEEKVWTIPAERMKAAKEHRVPLSDRCCAILEHMKKYSSHYIFPGRNKGKPLSNMAFTMLLRRLGFDHITMHGFRSTFRDWASEVTHHPSQVAEMALAHTIGNAVEAAYRRGDLFEKRRLLMADWADYIDLACHRTT